MTLTQIDFVRGKRIRSSGKAVPGEYNEKRFEGDILTPGLKGKFVDDFMKDGFFPTIDDKFVRFFALFFVDIFQYMIIVDHQQYV